MSTKTTKTTKSAKPDPWLALVLKSMGVDELTRESANDDNSDSERAAMRAELTRRSRQQVREQARADALATARVRLADEERAVALCEAKGYTTDAAVARRERDHYRALVARLEGRAS